MANLAKKIAFTHEGSLKETPLDKTTRIVRRITDNEADWTCRGLMPLL